MITLDRGSRNLQLDQIQNMLTTSTVLLCVFGLGRGGTRTVDSARANQEEWGFETTACGALNLWGCGPACGNGGRGYGRSRDGEEVKVLQRPEGERGTDCLLHWRLVPHT